MNPNDPENLRQTLWRKPLSAKELDGLGKDSGQDPATAEDLKLEAALTRALKSLPKAEIPSNFSSRLWQELDKAPANSRSAASWISQFSSRLAGLVPRLAVGAIALAMVALAYHEHTVSRRTEMAHSLTTFSAVASLPSMEVLEDFDTIQRLKQAPPAVDLELLAVLQ